MFFLFHLKRVLILASGRGSDFQALVDHEKLGVLRGLRIEGVVCNHEGAMVLERARSSGKQSFLIPGVKGTKFESKEERESARERFDQEWLDVAKKVGAEIVALAGFDQIISNKILQNNPLLIINIHPAYDLHKFGGRNMIGTRVHELVLSSGVRFSGCTVHAVTSDVDLGAPILKEKVGIAPDETVESLERKVLALEHLAYPKALQLIADERVILNEDRSKCYVDRLSANWEEEWNSRQERYLEMRPEESAILKDRLG